MDDGISDILESVTRAHDAHLLHSEGLELSPRSDTQQRDLELLIRAWTSERTAPELLPYPHELMQRVLTRIRQQIENVEELTSRSDLGTSFGLVVIQTELERFKYLVRSYLRARIAKIDAHLPHVQAVIGTASTTLLSPHESQYLAAHAAILERHHAASFLSSFPPKLRRLDDKAGAGGTSMTEGPDLDRAVFIRCLGANATSATEEVEKDSTLRTVRIACGFADGVHRQGQNNEYEPTSGIQDLQARERAIDMIRGEIWIVRWSAVRNAVLEGECELI